MPNAAARRLHRENPVPSALEAGDFAVLQDIDTEAVGAARKAPGDRIMAGRSAAALQEGTQDGISRCRPHGEIGHHARHILAGEDLGIDAVADQSVDSMLGEFQLMAVVDQHHPATLAEHDVEIQLAA